MQKSLSMGSTQMQVEIGLRSLVFSTWCVGNTWQPSGISLTTLATSLPTLGNLQHRLAVPWQPLAIPWQHLQTLASPWPIHSSPIHSSPIFFARLFQSTSSFRFERPRREPKTPFHTGVCSKISCRGSLLQGPNEVVASPSPRGIGTRGSHR